MAATPMLNSQPQPPQDRQTPSWALQQPPRRQAVQLRGEIRMAGQTWPVLIGDMPGSGAILFIDQTPPPGEDAELWVEQFGCVPVELVHSCRQFCGCIVSNPAVNRDRLMLWLRHALKGGAASLDRSSSLFLCAAKERRKQNLRPR